MKLRRLYNTVAIVEDGNTLYDGLATMLAKIVDLRADKLQNAPIVLADYLSLLRINAKLRTNFLFGGSLGMPLANSYVVYPLVHSVWVDHCRETSIL